MGPFARVRGTKSGFRGGRRGTLCQEKSAKVGFAFGLVAFTWYLKYELAGEDCVSWKE